MYYFVVLFSRPLSPLSYQYDKEILPGSIVQVPLGRQSCTGIVTSSQMEKPAYDGRIRSILEVVDPEPFITPPLMATLVFMSNYYRAPLGFCLKHALPVGMMRSGVCLYRAGETVAGEGKVRTAGAVSREAGALFATVDEGKGQDVLSQVRAALRESADGLSETEIRKRFKIDSDQFQSWVDSGVLVPHWTLDKARLRETTETVYEVVPQASPKRLGTKQKQMLAWISEQGGAVRHSAILAQFGPSSAVLHRLEALGLLVTQTTARDRTSFDDILPIVQTVERTDEQNHAIRTIVEHKGFGSFLLHGVTGSGKTEVYLGVMESVRQRGGGCIFVLPEIALTPQFCAVFRGRFGQDVAVLHSGLSDQERFDTWTRIRSGRIGICIGPRSALFAPVRNLGLIVIDEEHDGSFKQGETPRYHARDMALVLGQQAQCPVILGSATPSLESYTRALQGKSILLELTRRPQARPMPEITLVDMRRRESESDESERESGGRFVDRASGNSFETLRAHLLSDTLVEALRETLAHGEQSMIFLNRRGFSTFIQCEYCGHVLYCPNCDVALTYYKYADALRCHYCDYVDTSDGECPKCHRRELSYTGYGTERLVEILSESLPGARIDRLDRDRATTRAIQSVLGDFRSGKIDVLVGTQMIAKGHDIHNVTLVGIINADMGLHMPDFRSSERTYQLLTQVSGRAGRGSRPGRVIVQTLRPDHPAIRGIVERDYASFARQELEIRRALSNPPFSHLVLLRFESPQVLEAENLSIRVGRMAQSLMPRQGDARVLGPAPAPIPMLCGKFRFQLFLRHSSRGILHQWLDRVWAGSAEWRNQFRDAVCTIDVDPYDMM